MTDASARDVILDAAEQLFARQGFAATTIKEIGAAAGVNAALLYYYFADKATLYEAVLRRVLQLLATHATQRLSAPATPEDALRAFVAAQVEVMSAHPNIPKLVVREMIDHDAAHAQPFIADTIATVFKRLCEVIRAGQRTETFRADVRPEYAAISTISQVVYLFVARPAVALLLGHQDRTLPERTSAEFAKHAGDFAVAALAAPSRTRKGPR
jgi:TetR/AcrR family transcriptional regulator